MSLYLVVSGKDIPYIVGQWEECSFRDECPYIGGKRKNAPYIDGSMVRMLLTLAASGKNVPYIGRQNVTLQTAKNLIGVMFLVRSCCLALVSCKHIK